MISLVPFERSQVDEVLLSNRVFDGEIFCARRLGDVYEEIWSISDIKICEGEGANSIFFCNHRFAVDGIRAVTLSE